MRRGKLIQTRNAIFFFLLSLLIALPLVACSSITPDDELDPKSSLDKRYINSYHKKDVVKAQDSTSNRDKPLEEISLLYNKEGKLTSKERDGVAFCLVEGCHTDISNLDQLKAMSGDIVRGRSAHYQLGTIHFPEINDCGTCHKMHEPSVVYCTKCHGNEVKVPDGWLTFQVSIAVEN